ncbi:MAG: hypothetical protein M1826_005157 [Phylliscum demangeonii]|nr:MAG: hypothetical protein M1826_005157 [Phylliscum demangeonii]
MGAQIESGDQLPAPAEPHTTAVSAANQEAKAENKTRRGLSRFLSMLNCCAARDGAHSMADPDAEPDGPPVANKVVAGRKLPSLRGKQRQAPLLPPLAIASPAPAATDTVEMNMLGQEPKLAAPAASVTDSKEPLDEVAPESEKTMVAVDGTRADGSGLRDSGLSGVDAREVAAKADGPRLEEQRMDGAMESGVSRQVASLPAPVLFPPAPATINTNGPDSIGAEQPSPISDEILRVQPPTPIMASADPNPSAAVPPTTTTSPALMALYKQDPDTAMADAPPSISTTEDLPPEQPPTAEYLLPNSTLADYDPPRTVEAPASAAPAPTEDHPVVRDATAPMPEGQYDFLEQQPQWLLPPVQPHFKDRKCLVLDLDETLVHSSFKILHQADFTIPVEIEGQYHNVYVIKRPGVDQFMKRVGELYEVVVFTASVSKYGDPLLDQLDIHKVVHHRLFRESCFNHQGNYVKDLSQVGRDLRNTIIIDNSPTSYIFHPQHAVPISSWFSDAHDNELLDLIPVLEDLAGPQVKDVSLVLDVSL